MYQNIITTVTEISEVSSFEITNPFYVFLLPKSEDMANVVVTNGKPTYNNENTDLPLMSGLWNPIALNKIEITSEMISNYRIFIGYIE